GVDVQFAANLRQCFLCVLVLHDGSPRNHTHAAKLCQVSNQLISHAISKVVLPRITGKIFQWQHRDGVNRTIAIAPQPLACTGDVETQKDSKQQRTTKQAGHDAYGKSAQTIRGFRYAFFYPQIRFCNAGVFCDRSAFRDWSYEAVTSNAGKAESARPPRERGPRSAS